MAVFIKFQGVQILFLIKENCTDGKVKRDLWNWT